MKLPKIALAPCIVIFASMIFLTSGCQLLLKNGAKLGQQQPRKPLEKVTPKENAPPNDPSFVEFLDKTQQMMRERDFEALEAFGLELVSTKQRLNGGGWKIYSFDLIVASPLSEGPDVWETHLKFLREWSDKMPASMFARVAMVNCYIGYAWVARGDGYSGEIPRENMDTYRSRIEKASSIAEEASHQNNKYTGYYASVLSLGNVEGWHHRAYDDVFDEAVAAEPGYQYFYTAKAVYLLPRWNGEPGEWENFADEVKAELGETKGLQMYFLIVADIGPYYGIKFFRQNKVSWEDTKKGFALFEKEYGMSRDKLNRFGQLAFHAKDTETSCSTWARLQGENDFQPDLWDDRKKFETYRKMAGQMCNMPKAGNQAK